MTKLESRPKRSSRFEYLFFLDVEGNQATQRVQEALVELRASTSFLKILGSYPTADRERTEPGVQALLGTGEDRFSEPGEPERTPRSASPAPSTLTRHLAGQAPGQPASVVVIGGIPVGGDDLVIFAGPSHITSEEQIRQCARHVRECGGRVLIGGCFQPQGSPSGLPELARERLDWLVAAGRAYDLPVVTEVITPADVEIVSEQVDALLIGPHNMQNVNLLSEVGSVHCPIVLVRGLAATVDQFLTAADCVLGRGNQQVILCEQGVRTFGTTTRNTLDLGAIPVLKQRTSLPIVVDPSHAAGQRELVAPLALAARAIEPHGLMIEVDPVPDATPDGSPQALDTGAFRQLMAALFR